MCSQKVQLIPSWLSLKMNFKKTRSDIFKAWMNEKSVKLQVQYLIMVKTNTKNELLPRTVNSMTETDWKLTWDWPETDLKLTWDWTETDLRLTFCDWPRTDLRQTYKRKMKIQCFRQVCVGQTDAHTEWLPELLTEPKKNQFVYFEEILEMNAKII